MFVIIEEDGGYESEISLTGYTDTEEKAQKYCDEKNRSRTEYDNKHKEFASIIRNYNHNWEIYLQRHPIYKSSELPMYVNKKEKLENSLKKMPDNFEKIPEDKKLILLTNIQKHNERVLREIENIKERLLIMLDKNKMESLNKQIFDKFIEKYGVKPVFENPKTDHKHYYFEKVEKLK